MRRALPILALLTALAGCKHREGDVLCSGGALAFSKPATLVASPAGTLAGVRIAAVGSNFVVVWSSGPSATDNDLYGRAVAIDGTLSSNEVRLTQAAGISSRIRLAPGAGGIGISWTDGRLAQQVAMASVLPGGALVPLTSPAVFQSPVIAGDQEPIPAIAALGNGFGVAWNGRGSDGFDHLYAQALTSSGAAAGAPFPLAAAQEDRAKAPSAIGVTGSSSGIVIVDEELRPGSGDADVFAYLVAGTAALGSARYGATSEAKSPEAVAYGGGGGVVWVDSRGGLYYARFGSGEVRLLGGSPGAPTVAATGDGFLLQWIESGDVRIRAFQGDGRPDGAAHTAGSGGSGDIAWNGAAAGVVWSAPDGLWFRPLACE